VEEEGGAFARRYEVWHFVEQTLSEQQPIERFAEDEVTERAFSDGFFRDAPAADSVEQCFEPVLTVNHGLAHAEDGFIGRGYARPGRIICGFDALPRCIEGRITSHGHATS